MPIQYGNVPTTYIGIIPKRMTSLNRGTRIPRERETEAIEKNLSNRSHSLCPYTFLYSSPLATQTASLWLYTDTRLRHCGVVK